MVAVRLLRVTKGYGAGPVVDDLSLEIGAGELVSLLGPSGCGKTTTLNMVAGFVGADRGVIEINGRDVTALPAFRRNTAMVFQNYALFPHLDVNGNVAFGLKMQGGVGKAEIRRRVEAALTLVKMEGFGDRLPRQLSGGQQQRVALARALVVEPEVLLLDEPLSNLDAKLREEMRLELRQLQRRLKITTIFVTHDQEEAFAVSDRIAVMHKGCIEQLGAPETIYRAPRTRAVADFIGRMNWLPGMVDATGTFVFRLNGGAKTPSANGRSGHLCIRPEHLLLSRRSVPSERAICVTVEACVYLGPKTQYHVRAGDTALLALTVAPGEPPPQESEVIYASWDASHATFVPEA